MGLRQREPRKPVQIGVRLKDDAGWCDAQIVNVSSRGVMAVCADPPCRGSYVEIRRGAYVLVGHVAWSGEDRFGARVRETINIDDLLMPVSPGRKAPRKAAVADCQVRVRRKPSMEERAEASARFARAFDFAAIALLAVGLAVLASTMVGRVLQEPITEVEQALSGATAER